MKQIRKINKIWNSLMGISLEQSLLLRSKILRMQRSIGCTGRFHCRSNDLLLCGCKRVAHPYER